MYNKVCQKTKNCSTHSPHIMQQPSRVHTLRLVRHQQQVMHKPMLLQRKHRIKRQFQMIHISNHHNNLPLKRSRLQRRLHPLFCINTPNKRPNLPNTTILRQQLPTKFIVALCRVLPIKPKLQLGDSIQVGLHSCHQILLNLLHRLLKQPV